MLKVLFRRDRDNQEEFEIAQGILKDRITEFRSDCDEGDLVMGRYSVLPFYADLEREIKHRGAELINTYAQHCWVADMEQWYHKIPEHTPRSYFNVGYANAPDAPHGWVVKGRTNSRKFQWNTKMRARTREELESVMRSGYDDPLLSEQGLVVREFVPLRTYEYGINGMPVTNEWRCFFWGPQLIASGYYWSQASDVASHVELPEEARKLATEVAMRIYPYINFFVIDVGEMVQAPHPQEGSEVSAGWTVIEVNSGQMAGISAISPEEYYQAICDAAERRNLL